MNFFTNRTIILGIYDEKFCKMHTKFDHKNAPEEGEMNKKIMIKNFLKNFL